MHALWVEVQRALKVAADVADAGEQRRALALVLVRLKLLNEIDLEKGGTAGDGEANLGRECCGL